MLPKLGIISGGGALPREIIAECQRTKRPYYVVALKGQAEPETVANTPHSWVRLGAAGHIITTFRNQNIDQLVMAGSVKRPSIVELMPDLWAIRFFARTGVRNKGDDSFLKALIATLEKNEGFQVVGAHTILPGLLAIEGIYGDISPTAEALHDVKIAWDAALELGKQDIGQAVIARNGTVIAKENAKGTAAMIANVHPVDDQKPAGVLVKVSKPGQEKRADLPTIGPETITQIAKAGLAGVVVEAGKSLVLNKLETIKAANKARVFVVGRSG